MDMLNDGHVCVSIILLTVCMYYINGLLMEIVLNIIYLFLEAFNKFSITK